MTLTLVGTALTPPSPDKPLLVVGPTDPLDLLALAPALPLARSLVEVANGAGVKTAALITDMNPPTSRSMPSSRGRSASIESGRATRRAMMRMDMGLFRRFGRAVMYSPKQPTCGWKRASMNTPVTASAPAAAKPGRRSA